MKTNRSAILHFWQNGERSPAAISRMTKIKQQGTIEDRPRQGRPRKISSTDNTLNTLKDLSAIICFGISWTVPISFEFYKIILFLMRKINLADDGDYRWTMIQSIEVDWPSNSLDVNPVENLWAIIERRIEKRKPGNIEELNNFLHEEWNNIDTNLLSHLVNSMKTRCLALIESKGERINY